MIIVTNIQVPDHLRNVQVSYGDIRDLSGAGLVAVSSVKFESIDGPTSSDPLGYETARFNASLRATEAYAAAGVPQIVMVDNQSHYLVPVKFGKAGAIVVRTPRPGLATPYLDGARLAQVYAGPSVSVLKAESDKKPDAGTIAVINDQLHADYEVLVGDRTVDSLESMSAAQQRPETVLDSVIAAVLDIPRGASSGVQAYSPAGLEVFLAYEGLIPKLGNNWKYLLHTPAAALRQGLDVTDVPVNVIYDEAMVAAENTPALTLKRLEQLLVMLEGALEVSALFGDDLGYLAPSQERMAIANGMLATLRELTKPRQTVIA